MLYYVTPLSSQLISRIQLILRLSCSLARSFISSLSFFLLGWSLLPSSHILLTSSMFLLRLKTHCSGPVTTLFFPSFCPPYLLSCFRYPTLFCGYTLFRFYSRGCVCTHVTNDFSILWILLLVSPPPPTQKIIGPRLN